MLRRCGDLPVTVDPVLREHAGYGVEDLVELILRRVDAVACRLASTWHSDVEQNLGSLPDLRPEELIAAAKLPPIEDQIEQCSNPQRALSALQAHSVPAKSLRRSREFPGCDVQQHDCHSSRPTRVHSVARGTDGSRRLT